MRSELNIDTDGSIEAPNMSVNLIAPDGGFADIKLGSSKVFSLNTKDVLLDGSAGTARVGTDGGRAAPVRCTGRSLLADSGESSLLLPLSGPPLSPILRAHPWTAARFTDSIPRNYGLTPTRSCGGWNP